MKRSRINQVIKDMEQLIKEHGFESHRLQSGLLKTGRVLDMNMMKSAIINLDGILRITALENLMRSVSRSLQFETEIRRCQRSIQRHTQKNC